MMKTRASFIGMVCCSINTNKKEKKPNKKKLQKLAAEELQTKMINMKIKTGNSSLRMFSHKRPRHGPEHTRSPKSSSLD